MKNKKQKYMHCRNGDFVKIEIRDRSYRIIYKNKFNIQDKKAILNLMGVLEKFSGFSVQEIIKMKIRTDWF